MTRSRRKRKMDLTQRFFRHLKENKLILPEERVLVALSGGKDSVCLLQLLIEAKDKMNFTLAACHVNHGIRGEDADRDAGFCKALCQEKEIPFYLKHCNVPLYCKENKVGLEEGARQERYRILEETAQNEGFTKIAVAHSASDQAETVLFRLIRGTGFSGTRGISSIRGTVIRPLLPFYTEEIEEYLKSRELSFTQDLSNFDTVYARNRLRHEILPLLKEINPRVEDALCRFGVLSQWQEAMLEKQTKELEIARGFSSDDGALPLAVAKELAQDEGSLLLLFHLLSNLTKKHNISIDFVHFTAILSLLKSSVSGKIIEISDGFSFQTERERLVFKKNENSGESIKYHTELCQGETELPFSCGTVALRTPSFGDGKNPDKRSLSIRLDSDRLDGALFARSLNEGDRILMYGMHKSVKKTLCDLGIPAELRRRIPVVCDNSGIVWIPFIGLCDRVRNDKPSNLLELSLFGDTADYVQNILLQYTKPPKENELEK